MTTIGLSWKGSKTDKNGNTYFIISPEKDITPITIDDKKLLCFKMNPNTDNEKAPKWILDMFEPVKQEEGKTEQEKIREAESRNRETESIADYSDDYADTPF